MSKGGCGIVFLGHRGIWASDHQSLSVYPDPLGILLNRVVIGGHGDRMSIWDFLIMFLIVYLGASSLCLRREREKVRKTMDKIDHRIEKLLGEEE